MTSCAICDTNRKATNHRHLWKSESFATTYLLWMLPKQDKKTPKLLALKHSCAFDNAEETAKPAAYVGISQPHVFCAGS